MSRASDLRDAIVTYLDGVFTETVLPYWIPDFTREELEATGTQIGVRVGGREPKHNMGVDSRMVVIEVGVFALAAVPTTHEVDPVKVRRLMVAEDDKHDALVESILGHWTPDGPMRRQIINDHRFDEIGQPRPVDPEALHERRIWIGTFFLNYTDMLDEVI